ncbi:unnamed protein product [Clavelina lepadiformis]|uniref:CHHC U11-48K-type domain-containing protein n=1 Tax=Clavelina lepadiformis TaxID=159417 RepID=A0ABP0GAF6_CLALP
MHTIYTLQDVCPFNARHIVPKPELQMHMSSCPDRTMFEFEINKERLSDDGDEVKGCTSLPPLLPSQDLDFGDDEDWDLEVSDIIVGHEFRCIRRFRKRRNNGGQITDQTRPAHDGVWK